jgi:hypothetical protein
MTDGMGLSHYGPDPWLYLTYHRARGPGHVLHVVAKQCYIIDCIAMPQPMDPAVPTRLKSVITDGALVGSKLRLAGR